MALTLALLLMGSQTASAGVTVKVPCNPSGDNVSVLRGCGPKADNPMAFAPDKPGGISSACQKAADICKPDADGKIPRNCVTQTLPFMDQHECNLVNMIKAQSDAYYRGFGLNVQKTRDINDPQGVDVGYPVCSPVPNNLNGMVEEGTEANPNNHLLNRADFTLAKIAGSTSPKLAMQPAKQSCGKLLEVSFDISCGTFGIGAGLNAIRIHNGGEKGKRELSVIRGAWINISGCHLAQVIKEMRKDRVVKASAACEQLGKRLGELDAAAAAGEKEIRDQLGDVKGANAIWKCEQTDFDAATIDWKNAPKGAQLDIGPLRQKAHKLCAVRASIEAAFDAFMQCEVIARADTSYRTYVPSGVNDLIKLYVDPIIGPACQAKCDGTSSGGACAGNCSTAFVNTMKNHAQTKRSCYSNQGCSTSCLDGADSGAQSCVSGCGGNQGCKDACEAQRLVNVGNCNGCATCDLSFNIDRANAEGSMNSCRGSCSHGGGVCDGSSCEPTWDDWNGDPGPTENCLNSCVKDCYKEKMEGLFKDILNKFPKDASPGCGSRDELPSEKTGLVLAGLGFLAVPVSGRNKKRRARRRSRKPAKLDRKAALVALWLGLNGALLSSGVYLSSGCATAGAPAGANSTQPQCATCYPEGSTIGTDPTTGEACPRTTHEAESADHNMQFCCYHDDGSNTNILSHDRPGCEWPKTTDPNGPGTQAPTDFGNKIIDDGGPMLGDANDLTKGDADKIDTGFDNGMLGKSNAEDNGVTITKPNKPSEKNQSAGGGSGSSGHGGGGGKGATAGGGAGGGNLFGAKHDLLNAGNDPSGPTAANAAVEDSGATYGSKGGGGGSGSGGESNVYRGSGGATAGNTEMSFGSGSDAQGGLNPMGSEDPADYFARTGLDESIFKKVEKRYKDKSMNWAQEDLTAAASVKIKKDALK